MNGSLAISLSFALGRHLARGQTLDILLVRRIIQLLVPDHYDWGVKKPLADGPIQVQNHVTVDLRVVDLKLHGGMNPVLVLPHLDDVVDVDSLHVGPERHLKVFGLGTDLVLEDEGLEDQPVVLILHNY